jgi:hypothetical protein
MAIRVRPGIEQTRLMSRTPNVRKAEWDLIRGNHQGQRQLRCIKQAGHKTAPDLMSKLQKILAMQEPSTQDIGEHVTDVRFTPESGHSPKRPECPLSAKSGHAVERAAANSPPYAAGIHLPKT